MDCGGNVEGEEAYGSEKFNLNLDSGDATAAKQWRDQDYSGDDSRDDDDGTYDSSYFVDTLVMDDSFLLEDGFQTQLADDAWETQSVDLAGETQSVDLDGETQSVDLDEETAVMDHEEGTQLIDLAGETQAVDDVDQARKFPIESSGFHGGEITHVNDYEEQDKIEVMETQLLTQGDTLMADHEDSVALLNEVDFCSGKRDDNFVKTPSDTFGKEEHSSESNCRGFTSIHVSSSVSDAGFASHAQRVSLCAISNGKSSYPDIENKEESLWKDCIQDTKKPRNPNMSKTSIMRRLFTEDVAVCCPSEVDNHANEIADRPVLHESEHFFPAGLSYANSEEPGELSLANALEVVDRYIERNAMEYDIDLYNGTHLKEKANAIKGSTGAHDLVKSSILRSTSKECGAYDWDDTREDESGGDFFQRNKERFFGTGKSREKLFGESKKLGGTKLTSVNVAAAKSTGRENNMQRAKVIPLKKVEMFSNNLVPYLGDQSKAASMHNQDEDENVKNAPNMNDVGPDTQMAVEAMETLCFEVNLVNSNGRDYGESVNVMKEDHSIHGVVTRRSKRVKTTSANTVNNPPVSSIKQTRYTKKRSSVIDRRMQGDANNDHVNCHGHDGCANLMTKSKRGVPTTFGVVTRQTKRVKKASLSSKNGSHFPRSSVKRTKVIRKQNASESTPVEKNIEVDVNDDGLIGKEYSSIVPVVMKKQSDGSSLRKSSDIDAHGSTEIMDLKHETNPLLNEQLSFSIPIAHRTRICTKSCSADAGNKFVIVEEIIAPLSTRVPRRRRTSARFKHAEMGTIKNIDNGISEADNFPLQQAVDIESLRDGVGDKGSYQDKVQVSLQDTDKVTDVETLSSVESAKKICRVDASASERCGTFENCNSPSASVSTRKSVSPICMGSEYYKLSCRKNLSRFSLKKEIDRLIADSPILFVGTKELRKRKDNTSIRVLFSQHLDVDIVKQQKKILTRLGASDASAISDATHFVADEFVRTRNLLEAIAFGKPVVTHLWLESCGQTNCFVNEKNYILRDARKEKEFGFCMPVSLSRASQKPLLLGRRVLVTQNTKPGKNIISNLVKAVHGLVVERLGRSFLKGGKLPDDLFILSCEEDYDFCIPFLEKGCEVYSSELLLNGIVKQKLEFERYRLFSDQVRRTRSRILVKKSPTAPLIECK